MGLPSLMELADRGNGGDGVAAAGQNRVSRHTGHCGDPLAGHAGQVRAVQARDGVEGVFGDGAALSGGVPGGVQCLLEGEHVVAVIAQVEVAAIAAAARPARRRGRHR